MMTHAIRWVGAVTLAVMISAISTPAWAHPHVWIVAYSDAVFDDSGRIVAINIEWEFDEFYSAVAVEGLDVNDNGRYDAEELRPLAQENLTSLSDYDYLTFVSVDGELAGFGQVSEFGSHFRNGLLTLHFQLPLTVPVDPTSQAISYRMYDESFYIAIDYANAEAVTAVGNIPADCAVDLVRAAANSEDAPEAESFYESLVQSGSLGALYADTVSIACNGVSAS
jgi:ABC-type uncharacterized transport system substrate-binding protein